MDYVECIKGMLNKDVLIFKDSPEVSSRLADFEEFNQYGYELKDRLKSVIKEDHMEAYVDVLYYMTRAIQPKLIVELGVREALSSATFISALREGGIAGKLVSFDPLFIADNHPYFPPLLRTEWTYYPMWGEQGFEEHGKDYKNIDLLYIDTDPHSYDQTKMWFNEYWIKNLKPGGFILLDDATPCGQQEVGPEVAATYGHGASYGVLRACLEWINNNDDKIEYAFSMANVSSHGIVIIKMKD